jgi:hypothetical protein
MRKNLIVLASAALVITTATATTLYGRPVQTTPSAVTTLTPGTMHYNYKTMPLQEMSDLTFVFTE